MHRTLLALVFAVLFPTLAPAQTLDAVRAAGQLTCGTIEAVDDWNGFDQHGDLSSLSDQICRAVATAILGDPARAIIHHFPSELDALGGLQGGLIQLAIGISPAAETAVQFGVGFGPPVFFDTQRFLVPKSSAYRSAADLRDRLICAMNNTPSERTLRDEMTARGIVYGLQAHSEQGEMDASVAVARCAAGSAMESRLADSRADFPAKAPPFIFLPERFAIQPVVPAYRYGDQKFGLIVDWTVSALIEAEALGIDQANVESAKTRADMRAQRLLGVDRSVPQALGLRQDWAAKVIAAVGNYGEIFDRTIGKNYRLERGFNASWTSGGLMYPMPMQ